MEYIYGIRYGLRASWCEYTDEELRAAWDNESGQGHRQAVERGEWCVVVPCDEFDAISYSRLFVRHVFAIPTCCHYDSETLSLYCGDAGSGRAAARARAQRLVEFLVQEAGG